MIQSASLDTLIFDLDNTLYAAGTRLFAQVEARMALFISQQLELEPLQAHQLQKKYYQQYGTTLKGLMTEHQINADAFLDFIHEVDVSELSYDHRLYAYLKALPQQKLVYTNGSLQHAKNILTALGVWELFSGVFDIKQANYQAKPNPNAYRKLCNDFSLEPKRCLLVEDMSENLLPAAQMGMQTVLIATDNERAMQHQHHSAVQSVVKSIYDVFLLFEQVQ